MKGKALVLSLTLFLPAECLAQTAASSQTEASTASPELVEANKLSQQAADLFNVRRYKEALPLAKRVVEMRERALGPKHELVATSLNNVAEIYIAEKEYGEAEALYRRSLSILENRWGEESQHLVLTLERLALTRFAQHNFGAAEKNYQRALAITEKSFGPDSVQAGESLEALGVFYDRIEQPKKAAEIYQRTLTIKERSLAPTDDELVNILYRCACALMQVGQRDKAKEYIQRAEKGAPSVPVDRGVLQGVAIHRVQPTYPIEARRARIAGSVLVRVMVDQCGRVIEASSINGHMELVPAALRAAKEWRFAPTKLSGRPVRVIGTIVFNFTL